MRIPPWNQPAPPNLVVSLIVAALLGGIGGVLLGGLPGFGFLALADWMGKPLGLAVEKRLGSSLWGAAILIGLSWPAAFIPSSLLLHRLRPGMRWPEMGKFSTARWVDAP